MEFLKKHYEKILLGVVLAGLAVAIAFLFFKISADKLELEDKRAVLTHPKVQPLLDLDIEAHKLALERLSVPVKFDFSAPNRLFNPLTWQKSGDRLIPATKVGPMALSVSNISPLYLRLTLDSVTVSDSGARYVIGVENQAAAAAGKRIKKQTYCKLNDKTETFTLLEVKGPPEDPQQLVVQLNDGEVGTIAKDQAFQRVDGYMADLRYNLEHKVWPKSRVGTLLAFNGEDYNVVGISQHEVVLQAKSNQKKWTIQSN
jgi:hypothetical protein